MPQGIALFIVAVQKGVPMTKHEDRVLSLDGLRGLGALLVFLYHIDIMVKPFGDQGGVPSLFPGGASVMVFFVLSGIVLSLVPFKRIKDGGYDWLGYYPRRIVRLCVPLFAAILLALPAGYVAWRIGSTSRSALAIAYGGGTVRGRARPPYAVRLAFQCFRRHE